MSVPGGGDPPLFRTTCDLPIPGRPRNLRVHITGPHPSDSAHTLPILLFSHGAGLTGDAYAPLADGWARAGLAVVAPDHVPTADSPLWLSRVLDLHALASAPALLERALPALRARLDTQRLFAAGHSFGGHSVALLLGATPLVRPYRQPSLPITAGVLIAPPGDGAPPNLTPDWAAQAPYLELDWSGLRPPLLVVAGTRDRGPMSPRGWRWHTDAFALGPPGGKTLLVMADADHYFGGIVRGRGVADLPSLATLVSISAAYLLSGTADLASRAGSEIYRR